MIEPLPLTIPHLVEAAARQRGPLPALIEGEEAWSCERLWQECRAAASAMLSTGIGSGDRVAIWAPNSREWIVAAVAAMSCGGSVVPLNTRLKGRETGDILRRTRARMIVSAGTFLGTDYPGLIAREELPDLAHRLVIGGDWADFVATGRGADDPNVDAALAILTADQISDIMFTSGTTGSPKGVLTTHGRILPMFREWTGLMGLSEGERYLIINPFFHSFGFKAGWVAALIAGAVIVPMATFDMDEVIATIEREKISFLPGPPTIYQSLLAAKTERDFDISSLRGAATGAATVPPELIRRMRSELGLVDTVTAYGMTECSCITACRRGDDADLIATSCGKAIPGLEVRIADAKGTEVPRGETGEIHVRGYGVMLGYLDDPHATAEAIDTDGWLHTGDIGSMDEAGYVRITDRMKDMYISGGFNVSPAEVEKMLSSHPAIAQAAVVGIPDERMGEVGLAFVVLRPGASADEAEIAKWAREAMANYKAPRQVRIVSALPLNASGKVVKDELRITATDAQKR